MDKNLFKKYVQRLGDELPRQLSPVALSLYKSGVTCGNELYLLAQKHGFTRRDIAIIRQLNDCEKRFIGSGSSTSSDDRNSQCAKKFLDAVELCNQQNSAMESLSSDTMITLERARCDIDDAFWACFDLDTFGLLNPEFLWNGDRLIPISGFSSGTGSCTGVKGTSLLQKYRNIWSVSTKMGEKYLHILRKLSKPLHDLPNFKVELVEHIKAIFVPKSSTISRLIVPQLNGDIYLQYPAEAFLRRMLINFGIDLEIQQDVNRNMARKGSLHDNEDIFDPSIKRRKVRFCTLDLVSASDIVGYSLTKFLIPGPLFDYMDTCRAKRMELDGTVIDLPMMATMGNAYCFPLQTLIFSALIRATYWRLGLPLVDVEGKPTWSVYGDDIIVDVQAYPYIVDLLKCLHMQPNLKKSFSRGFFRESCGGDYYEGYDIRPVFCEELKDVCDVYSLLNRLNDWGCTHSVDVSWTIALFLENVSIKTVVPSTSGPHAGLRIPEITLRQLPKDWALSYKAVCSPNIKGDFSKSNNVYSSYHCIELSVDVVDTPIRLRKDESSLFYFLRGGISTSLFDKRERLKTATGENRVYLVPDKTSTKLVQTQRVVSIWDTPPLEGSVYAAQFLEQLNCYLNSSLVNAFKRRYKVFAAS